jgi:hypothetical protein
LEVLAHETAWEEMVALDLLTARVDHTAVAYPPVALSDGPVVQTNPVARLVGLGLERVHRDLSASVVLEEVVRLGNVIHAGAGRSGLDNVHGYVNAGPKLLARGGDHTLKSAQAPWSYSDDCDA